MQKIGEAMAKATPQQPQEGNVKDAEFTEKKNGGNPPAGGDDTPPAGEPKTK